MEQFWAKMQQHLPGSWSATTKSGATIRTKYKLVSDESALLETYTMPSGQETITVYTDGPFVEAKEEILGFALVEVSSHEEALEVSRRFRRIVGDGDSILHRVMGP